MFSVFFEHTGRCHCGLSPQLYCISALSACGNSPGSTGFGLEYRERLLFLLFILVAFCCLLFSKRLLEIEKANCEDPAETPGLGKLPKTFIYNEILADQPPTPHPTPPPQ